MRANYTNFPNLEGIVAANSTTFTMSQDCRRKDRGLQRLLSVENMTAVDELQGTEEESVVALSM